MGCEKTSKNTPRVRIDLEHNYVHCSNIQRLSLRSSNLSTLSVRHISDALCNIANTNTIQRLDLTDNCNVSYTMFNIARGQCVTCMLIVP